jgi:DNA-binding transcriptional MocR family regulator
MPSVLVPIQTNQYSYAMLYEALAESLAKSIFKGSLRQGDRLPSVRGLATQRHVSIATVLQAFQRLEDDGLVEVRPRSGHFVKGKPNSTLAEPRSPRFSSAPAKVSVSSGVKSMMQSMRDRGNVPLGAAQVAPELLPLRALNRTLSQIAREMQFWGADYGDPVGLPSLRKQLAKRAVKWGVSLHEDDFVVTVGAMEGLNLCLRAVARPNDTIAVESPTYFGVLQAIEQLGMRAIEVPSAPRTGLNLTALESVLKQRTISALLVSPNVSNPLGAVMSDENKERMVALCRRYDVPLIEDDVYGELAFNGRPRPALAWDTDGRVLLVGSVSKTLAPGYRIGWVVPGRYQEKLEALKYSLTVSTPAILQMVVAEFLAGGGYDRHLRRLQRRLKGQVDTVRSLICQHFPKETRVTSPDGGFVLWVELPPQVSALHIQHEALQHRIALAAGPLFGAKGQFQSHLRISCGYPPNSKTSAAIETLGQLVHRAAAQPVAASM